MTRGRYAGPGTGVVPRVRGQLSGRWRRGLALGVGSVLLGTYLGVFYHAADVTGAVAPFAASVGAALVLATAAARVTTTRRGLAVGGVLFVGGVALYVGMVPELREALLSVAFVRRWLAYLTGISVLNFRRVGLWAVAVAPGPAFLSWLLLLRRRYEAAALVGGGMLLFFTFTGDADPETALVGWTSLLGLLGAGTLEREAGGLGRLLELGFVLALGSVVARQVTVAPTAGEPAAGQGGASGGGGGTNTADPPVRGYLHTADPRADIHGAISLSPRVLFTIEADEDAAWHVSAYDRYTGEDWLRTGEVRPYAGPLEAPAGDARRVEQLVTAEDRVRTLPAAWRPVAVDGLPADQLRVTELGDVLLTDDLEPAQPYRVESARPASDPDRLRTAGTAYPDEVATRYGQLPASTPDRVRELAASLAGDAPTAYDAAVAIDGWLRGEKAYSLEVERPDGAVVDAFLFSMDAGYCVYFASAMTVLLRATGVPARFVLGYSSGQRVADGRWVVRGLDSHAWVQAYVPGVGWAPFDPTPATGRYEVRQNLLDAAREQGLTGVDTDTSRGRPYGLAAAAAGPTPEPSEDEGTATATEPDHQTRTPDGREPTTRGGQPGTGAGLDPIRALDGALGDRDRLSLVAGGVAATIGLHWLGVVPWARDQLQIRRQVPTDAPARDVARAARRLELALARRYRPKADGETTRQYVEQVGRWATREERRRVVELFERATYGGGVTRAEADEAIRLVDELVGDA